MSLKVIFSLPHSLPRSSSPSSLLLHLCLFFSFFFPLVFALTLVIRLVYELHGCQRDLYMMILSFFLVFYFVSCFFAFYHPFIIFSFSYFYFFCFPVKPMRRHHSVPAAWPSLSSRWPCIAGSCTSGAEGEAPPSVVVSPLARPFFTWDN